MARPVLTIILALALLAQGSVGPRAKTGAFSAEDVASVRVEKAARRLYLLDAAGRPLRVITRIQLGDDPVGAKRFEGDERTPEGHYVIDYANPSSSYHLSLHISYPDARDRAYAESLGRSPGGGIFIHGQPNSLQSGRIEGDWTDGCIALSNEEIEELWQLVPDGTPIEIVD